LIYQAQRGFFVFLMVNQGQTYSLLMGKTRIEWAAEKGLFGRILDRIRGFSMIEESHETRYFPIAEIHRPKISGCKATFSISSEESTDYNFSVKILGFGGGSGAGRSFGRNSIINAIDECLTYCVPVTIRWKVYQNNAQKFIRGDVVDIGDGHEVTPIHVSEDKCGMEVPIVKELGWETRQFRHEKIGGDFTEIIIVSEDRESNWKWGFKFLIPTLGETEIGFTGAVKTLKKINYQYELAGNHNYTAYNPPDSMSFYWNWAPET